ncbi:hypothetical protein PHYSODRAFT_353805 [Phytophthora sojae]|uniref:Uncharacterized protein n=1 Tax=Phytophthora sojae (strain P6497) TaxID=1094619 RepID=G4YU24_PHYSP|nr:hypothetical protein PHYSODRAFT_353805 [Phytophthora sojae]EGZ23102.1 hypothetical protein PHYSODRAFT_353805 [Phytophthora sojae]|eukprot:XP_009518390.1 hypothetical protein PHYSODRAFT_353805 [Phytophthora sojae]
MPLKWFRNHRSSSASSEDEATRSSTETAATKQKTRRNKSAVTQRSRRSHSHGSGLRAMFGLGGSAQRELDAAAAVAEEQRRISYQTKNRRRFTIHGISHPSNMEAAGWSCHTTPAGSPQPMSPSYEHLRHFGLASGRGQQMIPRASSSEAAHPSIIFIDCPP